MGAEAAVVGAIAAGMGAYFGSQEAAGGFRDARDIFSRQLGEVQGVRRRYQGDYDYWEDQARSLNAELTAPALGPEGVVPRREDRARAQQVGRQVQAAAIAAGVGPLGPRSPAFDAESRVIAELQQMARRERLGLMQIQIENAGRLRRDILGALQLENQNVAGKSEMQANEGIATGQGIQGLMSEIGQGIASYGMMNWAGEVMKEPGQTQTQVPSVTSVGGPTTAAGALMAQQEPGMQFAGPGYFAQPSSTNKAGFLSGLLTSIGMGGL